MKNITVTMDDTVAEWVRVEAAKRGSSVSRLLGEWLAEKMRQEDAYAQAMRSALFCSVHRRNRVSRGT